MPSRLLQSLGRLRPGHAGAPSRAMTPTAAEKRAALRGARRGASVSDDGRRPGSRWARRARRVAKGVAGTVGGLLAFGVVVSAYGCWRAPAVPMATAADPRPVVT